MNKYELYVLNRVLDGKDIFSVPSFSKIKGSGLLINDVKTDLIRKGILAEPEQFTVEGARLANRLHRFKEAKKQVKIGNLALGMVNGQESIALIYNPVFQEYKMEMVDSSDLAGQLVSFYPFLSADRGEETTHLGEVKMSRQEFNGRFNLEGGMHLHMVVLDKGVRSDEIYFLSDNIYYIYDRLKHVLSGVNYQNLRGRISERMQVG